MREVKRYMRRSPDTGVLGSGFGLADYVLASDYDRDTQALRAEIERYIQEGIKIADQRDELRAQVEVMRALLSRASGQIELLSDSMENLTEDDPEDGTSEILTEARDLTSQIDAALQDKQ